MNKLLIELQYLGTISWYLTALKHKQVMIEAHENFEKSTYRNRCCIAGPDGKLRLTVPLLHGRGQRSKYSELEIAYHHNWQKDHWNALCSCYRNSPYFEYYEDRLEPFYTQQFPTLFEFNKQLLKMLLELLKLDEVTISFSEEYIDPVPADVDDFRSAIVPQVQRFDAQTVKYRQVFEERTGFIPDMCILDLLFNEGPHGKDLLMKALADSLDDYESSDN